MNDPYNLSTKVENPSSNLSLPLCDITQSLSIALPIPTSVKDPNNNMSDDDDGERVNGCQMVTAKFLYCMCLALRA